MKENRYDDEVFFAKYGEMLRSKNGLKGAGEWPELKNSCRIFMEREFWI